MLKENIEKIFNDYLIARNERFTNHPIAAILRYDIPNDLKILTQDHEKYKFSGSAGQGNWTHSPWVGVFNKKITESAQRGYYIVYLFREDMKGVYLSLNQGMTEIRNQSANNNEAKEILKNRASNFRKQLKDQIEDDFLKEIDLGVENSPNAPYYEAGNIYSKYYPQNDLPSEEVLESDFKGLLRLYNLLAEEGGILKVIEDPKDIKEAQVKFLNILQARADERIVTDNIKIGLSEKEEVEAYWSNDLGFWLVNRDLEIGNRYFNGFGINKPDNKAEAVCEINIEKSGINRKTAGAFAKDSEGNILLIHRGKIGTKSKNDFFEKYSGKIEQIQDGNIESNAVVIGRLEDPELPEHVRDFIYEVARIKEDENKFKVIENGREIEEAQNRFIDILKNRSTKTVNGKAGFQGGQETGEVYWADDLGIWLMTRKIEDSRYWNGFGIKEPSEGEGLTITAEINFPIEGIDRRIAGAFVTDGEELFVVHRGKLGGNFSKKFFDKNYKGEWTTVQDGDKESNVVLIGGLNDPELPENVSEFVFDIARIKGVNVDLGIKNFIETILRSYKGVREREERVRGHRISGVFNDFTRKLKVYANSFESTERYNTKSVHFGNNKFISGPYVYLNDQILENDYYIGYMFREDMQGVYLALNISGGAIRGKFEALQNESISQEEFTKKFLEDLRYDLNEKTEIPNYIGTSTEGAWFSDKTVYSIYYEKNKIPAEDQLLDDYNEIFRIYKLIESPSEMAEVDIMENNTTFFNFLADEGYLFDIKIIENFLLSLKVKPFIIFTGNSGTGKTKLAQLFAQYLSGNEIINDSNFVSEVKVGQAAKSGGWALKKDKFFDLYPILKGYENKYKIKVDNIPGNGNLTLWPYLFFNKSEEKKIVDRLGKLDADSKVNLEIILDNDNTRYSIIPIGANWTENRHLLGFFNIITKNYQKSNALNLILDARKDIESPYFLILDEMNLSHVERYFADFLSAMESEELIPLHSNEDEDVPNELNIPRNLLVIGTVNVDETTYMFSPKVLDRANTIEFKTYSAKNYLLNEFGNDNPKGDIGYLENPLSDIDTRNFTVYDLKNLLDYVKINSTDYLWDILANEIQLLQDVLGKAGFDFGFRVVNEILRFMYVAWKYEGKPEVWDNWMRYFDVQIKQKMLPKLHGSQRVLEDVLKELFMLCYNEAVEPSPRYFKNLETDPDVKYLSSALKIKEMDKVLSEHRYVSFIN